MIERFLSENIQNYTQFFGVQPKKLWISIPDFDKALDEVNFEHHRPVPIMTKETRLNFAGIDIFPDDGKLEGATPLMPSSVMESIVNLLTDGQLDEFSQDSDVIRLLREMSDEQIALLLTDPNEVARDLGRLLRKQKGLGEIF